MQISIMSNNMLVSVVWCLLLWEVTNGDVFQNNPFLNKVAVPQVNNNGIPWNSLQSQASAGQQGLENNVFNIHTFLTHQANDGGLNVETSSNGSPVQGSGTNQLVNSPSNTILPPYVSPSSSGVTKPFVQTFNSIPIPSSTISPPLSVPQSQSTLQLSPPVFPLILDRSNAVSPVFTYVTRPSQPSKLPEQATTPVFPTIPEPYTPDFPKIPELPKSPQYSQTPNNFQFANAPVLPNGTESSIPPELNYNLRQLCLKPRGQFPTGKCSSYINCWDEVVIEESCPSGLAFNTVGGYCDYPANVNCQGRIVDVTFMAAKVEQPQYNINPQLKKKCLQARGLFPSDNCFSYVNCWDDNAVEESCPPNLYFSEEGYCDYPSNVECNGRLTYENYVQKQNPAGLPPTNNLFVNPPAQSGNTGIYQETQGNSLDSSSQSGTDEGPLPNALCRGSSGLFPSNYCDKYLNCWNGLAVEQECAPELLFSEKGYCDFPQNVNCNGRKISVRPPKNESVVVSPTVTQTNQETAEQHSVNLQDSAVVEKCKGQKGQFVTERCNTYLDCWENSAIERECPPGLSFSAITGYCDFSNKVDCQNRLVPEKGNLPYCEDGIHRNVNNCSQYFMCRGGVITSMHECPSGLQYNERIGVCDFASRVGCSQGLNNGITSFVKAPDSASLVNHALECVPGRIYRLNLNCSSVAICRDEGTEVVTCPEGLTYDVPSDRCVLPQYARCYDLKLKV